MTGNLYTLRYREGNKGVILAFVEASSLAKAELVGQAFCNGRVNCKFIRVEDTIVADESILEPEPKPVVRKPAPVQEPEEVRRPNIPDEEAKAPEIPASEELGPTTNKPKPGRKTRAEANTKARQ